MLRQGFFTRFAEARQKAIFQAILAELEKTKDKELGDCAGTEASLAHLAWQKQYQLVNLQLEPDQALKRLAELEGTPLKLTLKADLEGVDPASLCARVGNSKDSLQRIARLFGKRSRISLLKRYPLRWPQWAGAVVLFLSLLTASGLGWQKWKGAILYVKPNTYSALVRDNVQQYEAFGVLDSTEDSNGERWYQVTEEYVPKIKPRNWSANPIGWISEKQSIPWRWTLVMRFTNPYNREPSLFFDSPQSALDLMQEPKDVRKQDLMAIRK